MLTPLRHTLVGQWHRDDRGAGALLFAPELVADEASRRRLVEAVVRVRAVQSPTLLGIADLVADGPRTWLLATGGAEPTLAEILTRGAGEPDLACLRLVLRDIANGLVALHAAGLVHGNITGQAAVISADGAALLVESGLAPALLNRDVSPDHDVRAWVALADLVGAQWARDDVASLRRLLGTVSRVEVDGLATIAAALDADIDAATRAQAMQRLVAARRPVEAQAPVDAAPAEAVPAVAAPVVAPVVPDPPVDPSATMLGARRTGEAKGTGAPASRPSIEPQVPTRFGSGVPADTAPGAFAALDLLAANSVTARREQRRRVRRRWQATIVVLIAVAGYLLWRSSWAVKLHGVTVTAHQSVTQSSPCAATVDFTGRIAVTGAGEIKYQWLRSDGTTSSVEHRNVLPGQHAVTAHLFWSFSGPSDYRAVARLKVWGARTTTGEGTALYRCG